MKVVKVDRRHALARSGFKVFLQFTQPGAMATYRKTFEDLHGPSSEWDSSGFGCYRQNTEWRYDLRRKRIWIKNEADLTLVLLKM